jgi:O-antigen ligase
VALFWTLSRSSITGLAVSAAAFGWLVARRRRFGTAPRSAILVTFGAALLAGLVWRGPDEVLQRFQDGQNLFSRLDAWRDGWRVVQDFPVAGTGLNTYSDAMLFYQTRNRDFHLAQAHNDYLQLLAEGGLLVALPALAALVLLVHRVRRNLHAARHEARGYWIRAGAAVGMLGVGVQEIFEFSLQIPANALLFCTLAAVAMAPVSVDTRHQNAEVPRDNIEPNE